MRFAFRHRLFNKQGAAERIGGIARVPLLSLLLLLLLDSINKKRSK